MIFSLLQVLLYVIPLFNICPYLHLACESCISDSILALLPQQEFVTELPALPASKVYMKHYIVLFQKIEVWISGLSEQKYDQS
jgi:hypothetical protein